MNRKSKVISLIVVLLTVAVLAIQSCAPAVAENTDEVLASSTPGEIPTWTLRSVDQTALPTATEPAPVVPTATSTPTLVDLTVSAPTPKTVTVSIEGGNLNARRGPGLAYNYVDVLYDGETVIATGRDRISRWIRVELPGQSGREGWITTETDYTQINGDISNLPFVETEPARPAFIRNCLPHQIWVLPADVYLLPDYEKPYNEERFWVGIFQVYDLENPKNKPIEEVDLSEGETVEILYDWSGEKSKCE